MTRRHTRFFFVAGTTLFAAIFIGLTIHSHTRFGELTHADKITPEVALGEALFRRSPPACFSCHSLQENIVLVGPSLAGLATRAAVIVQSPDYKGPARTPQDYVRESIVSPHVYLVPGQTFSFGGRSLMPAFDTILKPDEMNQLVAYLVTFK